MQIKSNKLLSLVVLLLLVLISSSLHAETAAVKKKLRVGVIAGLTGDWAAYGIAGQRGIQLASANDSIEFFFEDDQFMAAKAVSAFTRLVENEKIDAVIVSDDVTAAAISPLAERNKIPLLAWASENLTLLNKRYTIRLWPQNNKEVEYVKKHFQLSLDGPIQIFTSTHPYAMAWGNGLLNGINSKRAHIDELPWDMQDFKSQIMRAKQQSVKNFILCLNPGQNGRFGAQMRQLDFVIPVFGCTMLQAAIDIKNSPLALEGAVISGTKFTSSLSKQYKKVVGSTDHVLTAAVHYDAVQALLLANQKDPSIELIDRLLSLEEFSGAHTSVKIKSVAGDQFFDFPLALYKVHKTELQLIQE